MRVLKFGGSSVAKPERIKNVVDILKTHYYDKQIPFTVVFSAFGGVTDALIQMSTLAADGKEEYIDIFETFSTRHIEAAQELLNPAFLNEVMPVLENNHEVLKNLLYGIFLVREASTRSMDYVLSFGERNSAFIISKVMEQAGIPAAYLDARKIIKTNKHFGAAKVEFTLTNDKIKEYYNQNKTIQVVTGFIASAKGGLTTTLGRGGSDYTAAILAAGLDAEVIEIWTDVDGVLTADPRKVRRAFTIPNMTYAEAMEMSHFGAKVIYPPTLQPALSRQIPLYIKNTFNPTFEGTYISKHSAESDFPVKGISSMSDVAMLTLQGSGLFGTPGIASRLFSSLAQAGVNILLITQGSSEHSITFVVTPSDAKKAKVQVEEAFEYELKAGLVEPIKVELNLAIVAIIGENMRFQPGISGRMFQALGKNGVNIMAIAQGSSELNISVVISKTDESKALNALHESFFLSDTTQLHIFIIGVGLIGSTLIHQIQTQAAYLKENSALEIKVVGLSNTRTMLFEENGISLDSWRQALDSSPMKADLSAFVDEMVAMNLPNSIFVDNTASDAPVAYYHRILDSSISISTPNKIATSSNYLLYQQLKNQAKKRGVQFLYETNVGAGLPVITTLQDLIISGDRILKIEGVLSGSMSYVFNNFLEGRAFSDIVVEAKEKGFTEPDPRIDLNGIDVRRKLIILARETGLPLHGEDVTIHNILPQACIEAPTVEEFFTQLDANNGYFEELRAKAAAEGKVLRMSAKLDEGKASIGVEAVDATHPFYTLSGSDNMIVFTTERYKERPLVVRGPGAGAEVTAAGVFAEIIRIGNYLL